MGGETADRQRIDKWLWFARFAKTRTIAQKLVVAGKVRVNRDKIDAPARLIQKGDVLTITLERQVRVIEIAGIGVRRGPAPEAQTLYIDRTPPAEPASSGAAVTGGPRPTKRDRRAMDAWHSASVPFEGMAFPSDDED